MSVALALGERHLGATWPNPSVGALVVDESGPVPRVIARGITQEGGRPHAERVALEAAGAAARGATLFVSLEPCSHHGRTPPCVDAIVEAGIARVVTAVTDPDPRVSGRGHERLRAAGIEVRVGVLAAEAARSHRGHITRVAQGRPAVCVKIARTADGYAGVPGRRLLITGEAANGRTHIRRVHSDAVMIGVETALADDPLLTVRLPGLEDRSPVRIVLDSRLRLPLDSRLVRTARSVPLWIVTTAAASEADRMALLTSGAEVMRVDPDPRGRVDLPAALRRLAECGLTRIFCEGGPALTDALATADLVDEALILTAPAALGEPGLPAIPDAVRRMLRDTMVPVATQRVGPDLIEEFERRE